MDSEGVYEFETVKAAREAYETAGPVAQIIVKETAKAMAFDNAEYDERVTGEVIETARDALFASLLTTYQGSRAEFEAWCDDYSAWTVDHIGSDTVDSVVWHPVAFADTVVAASYQNEPAAAAATVRRRAFGREYRDRF